MNQILCLKDLNLNQLVHIKENGPLDFELGHIITTAIVVFKTQFAGSALELK